MSAEYSVEEVRARFEAWYPGSGIEDGDTSAKVAARFGYQAAYADLLERIKADEGAVTYAVARKAYAALETEGDAIECMRKALIAVWPTPPAQAAQVDASNLPPCSECGAKSAAEAETMCICSGDKDDCHGTSIWPDDAPTAEPAAQPDPGWPAPFEVVQSWALANGYSGATDAEACKAYREAHPAEPAAQGEVVAFKHPAAVRSTAAFLLEKFEHAPCDSSGVSCCIRCSAVAMSRWTIEALDSGVAAQHRAVPDGWVMVPIEPTDAMCDAGDLPDTATAYDIYKAMLAAAGVPSHDA